MKKQIQEQVEREITNNKTTRLKGPYSGNFEQVREEIREKGLRMATFPEVISFVYASSNPDKRFSPDERESERRSQYYDDSKELESTLLLNMLFGDTTVFYFQDWKESSDERLYAVDGLDMCTGDKIELTEDKVRDLPRVRSARILGEYDGYNMARFILNHPYCDLDENGKNSLEFLIGKTLASRVVSKDFNPLFHGRNFFRNCGELVEYKDRRHSTKHGRVFTPTLSMRTREVDYHGENWHKAYDKSWGFTYDTKTVLDYHLGLANLNSEGKLGSKRESASYAIESEDGN